MKLFLLQIISITLISTVCNATTILDRIRDDPDLSQFIALIERNKIAMASLELRSCTLFAPTNEAFQKYKEDATHILYHMSTTAAPLEQLSKSITSDMDGNPLIYITRARRNGHDNIWVNNALIVKSRSNINFTDTTRKQYLHVIDDILQPLTFTPSSSVSDIYNPDAFQFLTNSDSFNIGSHRIRSYRQKVIVNSKDDVYRASGGHTYFIPVEEGFKPHPRPDLIDKKVIDGHIISDKVIFTASAPIEEPFTTLAFEDNIKVTISFFTQGEGANKKTYVKSNTVVGDSHHTTGVVMAEIVRANIPVRNGVIHLIHRPLMIVDTTVMQFLEEKEDGPLFKFHETIMDRGRDFMTKVNQMKDITIFAPSNEAWNDPAVLNILGDHRRMNEILSLHVVRDRLNVERIRQGNINLIHQFPTAANRKNLYFNIIQHSNGNQTVTVEGGGVNATIIQPDIAQTNGYIHIIDRVLGIPYTTVYEKLRTDPMLNSTYFMGEISSFNPRLNDSTKRFTYFVPRDKAWQKIDIEFPTTHRKLFMPEFSYHTRSILERHLIVFDKAYTMADLKLHGNDSLPLPTIRDSLSIRIREDDKRYTIVWNNRNINVFRPDVECTNGIIHVIDHPFLEQSDVIVSAEYP